MTKTELKRSISNIAKKALSKHGLMWRDVVIDHRHSIVSVGDVFFSQGEDAEELISGIPDYLNERSYMLYYLDSAGAI